MDIPNASVAEYGHSFADSESPKRPCRSGSARSEQRIALCSCHCKALRAHLENDEALNKCLYKHGDSIYNIYTEGIPKLVVRFSRL